MRASASPGITATIDRVRRPSLAVGLVALAACAAGAFLSPDAFFRGYLFGYVFFTGLSLGCLAVVMLHHLTGGAWGIPIRRMLESGTRTLKALNPDVNVIALPMRITVDNVMDVIKDYDLVVDGSDNFETRYLVNDACYLAGKTNVHGSIFQFEGMATVFAPNQGPCYRCLYPSPPPPGLVPS